VCEKVKIKLLGREAIEFSTGKGGRLKGVSVGIRR
jgi:hypothetical protein